MAFTPSKKTQNDFNQGNKFKNGDGVQPETINNVIEGLLFAQENGGSSKQIVSIPLDDIETYNIEEFKEIVRKQIAGEIIVVGTQGGAISIVFSNAISIDSSSMNISYGLMGVMLLPFGENLGDNRGFDCRLLYLNSNNELVFDSWNIYGTGNPFPEPTQENAGKVLGVNSIGNYALLDVSGSGGGSSALIEIKIASSYDANILANIIANPLKYYIKNSDNNKYFFEKLDDNNYPVYSKITLERKNRGIYQHSKTNYTVKPQSISTTFEKYFVLNEHFNYTLDKNAHLGINSSFELEFLKNYLPTPSVANAGKVVAVKADGTGYELSESTGGGVTEERVIELINGTWEEEY